MKTNVKLSAILVVLCLGFSFNANAQFLKKLKNKINEATATSKTNNKKETAAAVVDNHTHSAWHGENVGQVKFYGKRMEKSSSGDSASGLVTEHVVGGPNPLSMRAYLDKDFKALCTSCDNMDIRYTIDGVSFTTRQLREENPAIYTRMASALSYYDSKNYVLGSPLISATGYYQQDYTLQEDTFRILLNKVSAKLIPGATIPMTVEVLGESSKVTQQEVMAKGTINLKVTSQSNTLQGPDCRCGKQGMTDPKLVKDVKEAFMFQFDDVKKVHDVVLLERSFRQNYDNSYPTKNVIAKGMDANIIYEGNNGIIMNIKRYIFFNKEGNGFSDKVSIGKHTFFVPISPTCVK
ncbi:hypothetical protein [Aequorivita sp. Q41]|uniref:hypothetical protein n=1 Tax=Aequorivita sp. Q41 TaxID=3153300 RepID=UPI003241F65D